MNRLVLGLLAALVSAALIARLILVVPVLIGLYVAAHIAHLSADVISAVFVAGAGTISTPMGCAIAPTAR